MLSRHAIQRLRNEVALNKILDSNDEFQGFLEDIKQVCDAVEIYRDLAASDMWDGTGDEILHTEYLKIADKFARKWYKRRKKSA